MRQQLQSLDADLESMIKDSGLFRLRDDLFQSTSGVGPVLSQTRLAHVPELGQLNRKQIAALRRWDAPRAFCGIALRKGRR
jgi:transposase